MARSTVRTFVVISLLLSALHAYPQRKEVIGYYPSWRWRDAQLPLTPARIPFDKLTVINYAFYYPRPDGTIEDRDSLGQAYILRGVQGPANPEGIPLTQLAHQHGVKVMLSLGGWGESGNFPVVAGSDSTRRRFAHACADFIREFDFDGIDIDWEYPGYLEHNGTPADRDNFTALLRVLRDSLTHLGAEGRRTLLLTAALPGGTTNLAGYDVPAVAALLDQLNIMTYDFYGAWEPLSGHNAPLHAAEGADSSRSVAAAFRLYHEVFGIPASKINLGVPFYGHAYAQCRGLHQPHAGTDTTHFSARGAFYADLAPLAKGPIRHWDDRAKVPYLIIPEWSAFVSYDDERSVQQKAEFVIDNNACGVIIWEITGDHMADGSTPLLDAIHRVFANGSVEN